MLATPLLETPAAKIQTCRLFTAWDAKIFGKINVVGKM
jgi:hypothetical protein